VFDSLSVYFLFIFQHNGMRKFKKNNVVSLTVLFHRSGLLSYQISSFSPLHPSSLLVRSHERQCPTVKIDENLTYIHFFLFFSVACCAGRCLFAAWGDTVSHSRWYSPMNSCLLPVLIAAIAPPLRYAHIWSWQMLILCFWKACFYRCSMAQLCVA
jgi:hypothetical protein